MAIIRKLIKWIPVILRDEDWDHAFLLEIVKTKMETMRDFWESDYTNIYDVETRLEQITRALGAATRLCEDEYLTQEMNHHRRMFGEPYLESPCDEVHVTYNTDDPEGASNIAWRLGLLAEARREKDWNTLWETIRIHGQTWWD